MSCVITIAVALLIPAPLAAYIDPVSGSILLQILAAGLLGAALTIKRFWNSLTRVARRLKAVLSQRG